MTCEEFHDFYEEPYVKGCLVGEERDGVLSHLAVCAECELALDRWEAEGTDWAA